MEYRNANYVIHLKQVMLYFQAKALNIADCHVMLLIHDLFIFLMEKGAKKSHDG